MVSPSPASSAAFAALTVSLAALWLPSQVASPAARWLWAVMGALSIVLALAAGMLDATGLLVLTMFASVCVAARLAHRALAIALTRGALLVGCAALFLHVAPGFDNPRILTEVITGPGAEPYTKFLNFDKGMAALLILGLYAPAHAATERVRWRRAFLWRFAVLVTIVAALTMAVGYVRWHPKLPPWSGWWAWSMVFFTALPEEVLFRRCLQTWVVSALRGRTYASPAGVIIAGVLFGAAHAAGGPKYVLLASAAGIGYGWIYASTRSLAAAVAAHAGLNTVHFLFFTYPALRAEHVIPFSLLRSAF